MPQQELHNVNQRLAAIRQYAILDTPPETRFDDITFIASVICDTPINLITFLDKDRQWFKSCIGLNIRETPIEWAFCWHAIQEPDEIFVVHDAQEDSRFCDNPLVTSEPSIRFYAGVPLVTPRGVALGTLCVIDRVPRNLSDTQLQALKALGRQVVARLEQQREIDDRKEIERRFSSALGAMQEGFVLQQRDGSIILSNPQAEQILGLSKDQMQGRTSIDPRWRTIHEDGTPFPGNQHPAMVALRSGEMQKNVIMGVYKSEGTLSWISINSSPIFQNEETTPYAVISTFTNIDYRLAQEEKINTLKQLASTDGLTGLTNHRKFYEDLEIFYQLSVRNYRNLSLLLIDVDNFKHYNDTYGHPEGDVVLKVIANTLVKSKRFSDLVARYGGEEFAIILPETNATNALMIAERFRSAVEAIQNLKQPITISIGISSLSLTTNDVADLVAKSDRALYASKQNGKNCITHFQSLTTVTTC
jgi:diguanylate cyclase (GGDEF)-like protein/PAS domain S-box-containing protein